MTTTTARFFVPRLPIDPAKRGRYARADWRQWMAQIRAHAMLRHVEPVDGPCRVVAVIRRPCAVGTPRPSGPTRDGWRDGIARGLAEAGVVEREPADVTIARVTDLPSWSNEGGVEIEIIPLETPEP